MYIAVRRGRVVYGGWHSGANKLIDATVVHMDYFKSYGWSEAHIELQDKNGNHICLVALTEGGIAFEKIKRMYVEDGTVIVQLDVEV